VKATRELSKLAGVLRGGHASGAIQPGSKADHPLRSVRNQGDGLPPQAPAVLVKTTTPTILRSEPRCIQCMLIRTQPFALSSQPGSRSMGLERLGKPCQRQTLAINDSSHGVGQPIRLPIQPLNPGPCIGHGELRRGRRCGRASVRCQIRNRDIDLMTDAAHDGQRTCANRSGHALSVEGHQVFEGTAPAHQQHQVDIGQAGRSRQRRLNLEIRALPLHPGRRDHQRDARRASASDLKNVVECSACWGRHHRNPRRPGRQHALQRVGEQALRFESAAELLEGQLKRTLATWLEASDDQLHVPARPVEADLGLGHDLEPILGIERNARQIASEENGPKLGTAILQHEVAMPGARPEEVADLTYDPDTADFLPAIRD